MVTFYLVRHGETLLNSLNRAQGWVDSPLTDAGKQTAVELGRRLAGVAFDAGYTSDTSRAMQTAELILSAKKYPAVPLQTDVRLREWCLGSLEAEHNPIFLQKISDYLGALSFPQLNERLPEIADAIHRHDTTGMAEPFSAIAERLRDVLTELAQRNSGDIDKTVLIVTHAFAIKTLLYLFAPEQLKETGKVKNGAVFRLRYEAGRYAFDGDMV